MITCVGMIGVERGWRVGGEGGYSDTLSYPPGTQQVLLAPDDGMCMCHCACASCMWACTLCTCVCTGLYC